MPSNHLILCHPLLFLPSIFPSIQHVSFPMNWLFASGGQSIGASTSASVLPMSIQYWFPLGLTGLIFFLSKELSRVFSSTTVQNSKFFSAQPSLWFNSHILKWLLEKPYFWLGGPLSAKWCLIFHTLSRFVTAFLPRSKRLLILWLQSPSTVILEPKTIKSITVSTFSPSMCHEVMGPDALIFVFWMISFKPVFFSFFFLILFYF